MEAAVPKVIPLKNTLHPPLNGIDPEVHRFLEDKVDLENPAETAVTMTTTLFNIDNLFNFSEQQSTFQNIVNLKRINDIKGINKFFEAVNKKLEPNGTHIGCVETSFLRKKRLMTKYPAVLNQFYYVGDFILKRVFPKLWGLRKVYFLITAGRNRVLTKGETLGRLCYCGFRIEEIREVNNLLYFVARKKQAPKFEEKPSFGPIFRMKRLGKNGKPINVYKLRTMQAYSEYIQDYIYDTQQLKKGGKFNNDFRITRIGRFLRKYWLDELPMIYNLMKGELKLVGVRPLSNHYLSLYPQELVKKRQQFKPGLLPPFYADLPETLDEIIASENRYLDRYAEKPMATDLQYFAKVISNIIFRQARSQ